MFDLKALDPQTLIMLTAFNPAVVIVAFKMGHKADQWQKLIIAAYAAALVGFLLLYVMLLVGAIHASSIGGEAGIVILQMLFGSFWALAGFGMARRSSARNKGIGANRPPIYLRRTESGDVPSASKTGKPTAADAASIPIRPSRRAHGLLAWRRQPPASCGDP